MTAPFVLSADDYSIFAHSMFVLAKNLASPNMFQLCPSVCPDGSACSDQSIRGCCEAVQMLTSWLTQLPPVLEPNVVSELLLSLDYPRVFSPEDHFKMLKGAISLASPCATEVLRPLLLFLQQYVLTQEQPAEHLQQVSDWLAPILFPSSSQIGGFQGRLLVSGLVSHATEIFGNASLPRLDGCLEEQKQKHHQKQEQAKIELLEETSEELVDMLDEDDAWRSDATFGLTLDSLIAEVTSVLFNTPDDGPQQPHVPEDDAEFQQALLLTSLHKELMERAQNRGASHLPDFHQEALECAECMDLDERDVEEVELLVGFSQQAEWRWEQDEQEVSDTCNNSSMAGFSDPSCDQDGTSPSSSCCQCDDDQQCGDLNSLCWKASGLQHSPNLPDLNTRPQKRRNVGSNCTNPEHSSSLVRTRMPSPRLVQ